MKRGEALEARHDYNRAILEFKNAAEAMPSDPQPEYRLGMAYLKSGQGAKAMAALREAVQIDPRYAPAQLKLADLMLNSQNRDLIQQAATQLESMLQAHPGDEGISGRLAIAEWTLGKPEDAEKRLEQLAERFPADLRWPVGVARLKLSRGDAAGATQALEQAARSAPRSAPAAIALAEVYLATGKTPQAEAELNRALGLDAKNGTALLRLAGIQLATGRQSEAEANLRRLSDLPDPAFNGIYGEFLMQNGRRDAALAEFEKQAKAAPGNRAARSRLIDAYLAMNRVADAQRLLAEALRKNPQDTDALLERAIINLQAGLVEEAQQDLNQVIQFLPNSAEAHFALASVYKTRGLVHEERQELSEALRLNPYLLPARLWLVQSLLVGGENQSALSAVDQAPAAQQQVLALVIERNWALLFLGRGEEVRKVLDQALHYGRYPELLLQDAVLKMKDGQYAGARDEAEEVLRKNPEEARAARVVVDSYVAQQQNAKAGEWLAQTVAAHPQSAPLARLSGKWFASLHDNAAARQAFLAARAADPKSVEDNISLAQLDLADGQLGTARGELTAAVGSDARNLKALLLLAEVEERSGNAAAAAGYDRQVLAIDGNNILALNNLANYVAPQDSDEALKLAQHAMETAPDNAGVEDTLGWIYYRKGMYREALEYLKAAADKAPSARHQLHLGMDYLKLGDRDRGRKLVALALQADPLLSKTQNP